MLGPVQERLGHRTNLVIGAVEARPNQVVHRRINDHEPFALTDSFIQGLRHEDAGIADDHATRFHDEVTFKSLDERRHGIGQFLRQWRRFVGIGDAEPAADVDIPDVDPLTFEGQPASTPSSRPRRMA